MIYVFDIDDTICKKGEGQDYPSSVPMLDRIEYINCLYNNGNKIVFYTARGMGRYNGDVKMVYKEFYDLTKEQLKEWGVKYHELQMGKPSGDFYIDDKAISDIDFFNIEDNMENTNGNNKE